MKVIFLDIDGVLNSDYTVAITKSGCTFVDIAKVIRLKWIVEATNAKLVLSSDWRYDRNISPLNEDFLELKNVLTEYGLSFYDFTPEINWMNRELEIQTWLNKHPEVDKFIILDDRTDFPNLMEHLVHTRTSIGLTSEKMQEAIAALADDDIPC